MNIDLLLKGAAILLGLQWLSVAVLDALGSRFPAALLGMLLLAVLLLTKAIRLETIEPICTLLIKKMGMLFLPAAASILLYVKIIRDESLAIFATIGITSMAILIVTAAFLQFCLGKEGSPKK